MHANDTRFSLTFMQMMAEDWKQGKRQTFELSNSFDGKYDYKIDTLELDFRLKYNIGIIFEDSEIAPDDFIRPTNNDFLLESGVTYPIGWTVNPFFSASAKSQITESFRINQKNPIRTAKFWDPITTQQNIGFAYTSKVEKNKILIKLGFALKQIRAYHHTATTDDRSTRDVVERYKAEAGISIRSETLYYLTENLTYRNKTDMFASYENLEVWTFKMENLFDVKVWKVVGISVGIDLNYNQDQSTKIQYNQKVSIGLITNF